MLPPCNKESYPFGLLPIPSISSSCFFKNFAIGVIGWGLRVAKNGTYPMAIGWVGEYDKFGAIFIVIIIKAIVW